MSPETLDAGALALLQILHWRAIRLSTASPHEWQGARAGPLNALFGPQLDRKSVQIFDLIEEPPKSKCTASH
jgi:hypothetical protein